MEKYYLVAVDIGTQGTKAAIFDEQMEIVGTAFKESDLIMSKTCGIWQESEEIYQSVLVCIKQLVSKTRLQTSKIVGISIDSQMAGIMGIDAQGEAITYYDSWLDTRCRNYVEFMEKEAGTQIVSVTGSPVTYAHGPKILWWKKEYPEIYKKINKFVLPHSFVVGKLTGLDGEQAYMDYTCIQYSGFGDNVKKKWSRELLELFQVEENKMPKICSPFKLVGYLGKTAADFCGLPDGIPIAAGAGDTSASFFGAGLLEEGTLLDCAGTASALSSVVKDFKPDIEHKTIIMMRAPIDGQWYPMAYINGGGLCLQWLRNLFGNCSYEELEKEAVKIEAGSEGLFFIPHFEGRVLPYNPYIKGSFTGLNWRHTKGHMYRAIMEGIAYEYRYYQTILQELYPHCSFQSLWAGGGGARSELFLKIKGDVLRAKVSALQREDTALMGTGIIAGISVGLFTEYDCILKNNRKLNLIYDGRTKKTEIYENNERKYLQFIENLTPVYKEEEI